METNVSELQRTLKPKTRTELVQEVAILELEVMQLERRLLMLYEKAFERRISSENNQNKTTEKRNDLARISQDNQQVTDIVPLEEYRGADQEQQEMMLSSSIHRCHSSLDHHSAFSVTQSSSLMGMIADAVYSYQSLPLALLQHATGEASDFMTNYNSCQNRLTANSLSEELIRCISAMYSKLAPNSMIRNAASSPAVSSISLISGSPASEFHIWTPKAKPDSSLDFNSNVPLGHGGFQELSGPYNSEVVEVLHICRNNTKMKEVQPILQKFRSLVSKLEETNPSKLKDEEKLAFWINVHNALVMHAYLVYGIPQVKLKRASLLLKAAYNVGGHTVSLGMMQNYILGTRLPHLGQWFQRFLSRYKTFRSKDESQCFAPDRPEPLCYFALSCGSHSDPPVRVYTPRRVYQELITARGDYMLCNYRVNKEENKVWLPKIVDNYVKASGLHPADFQGLLEQIVPVNKQRKGGGGSGFKWRRKGLKCVGWMPHEFRFRYQLHKHVFE